MKGKLLESWGAMECNRRKGGGTTGPKDRWMELGCCCRTLAAAVPQGRATYIQQENWMLTFPLPPPPPASVLIPKTPPGSVRIPGLIGRVMEK